VGEKLYEWVLKTRKQNRQVTGAIMTTEMAGAWGVLFELMALEVITEGGSTRSYRMKLLHVALDRRQSR